MGGKLKVEQIKLKINYRNLNATQKKTKKRIIVYTVFYEIDQPNAKQPEIVSIKFLLLLSFASMHYILL
jgi:hypothetical protein